jgi:uncharacterized protein
MTLILIRAENQTKILNSLADIERHAGLKINGTPKIMDNTMADKYAQSILNAKLRSRSKIAVVVSVQEDATRSILQIKKIHPPAHLLVISKEYTQWEKIKKIFSTLPPLKGYYSAKNPNLKKPPKDKKS